MPDFANPQIDTVQDLAWAMGCRDAMAAGIGRGHDATAGFGVRIMGALETSAEYKRLEMMATAAGETCELAWLDRLRADVATRERLELEAVNRMAVAEFVELVFGGDPEHETAAAECYVTLRQMAAIVQRSKATIRRLYDAGKLPEPAIDGGGGKPNEWLWGDVKPALEAEFGRNLPAVFPADRFVDR